MPEKQQTTDNGGSLLDAAIDLLKWIDNPKKMLIAIILVSFGLISYSMWESRTDITRYLMKQFAVVEIDRDALDGQAISLMKDLDADVINIWSADPARNRKTLMYRRTLAGLDTTNKDKSDVLFRADSNLIDPTVTLLNARTVCQPIKDDESMQASPKTNYMCAVSVPPAYADGFVGVIVLGFDKQPLHEDYVLQRMSQASQAIIK